MFYTQQIYVTWEISTLKIPHSEKLHWAWPQTDYGKPSTIKTVLCPPQSMWLKHSYDIYIPHRDYETPHYIIFSIEVSEL